MSKLRKIEATPEFKGKIDRAYELWLQLKEAGAEFEKLQDEIRNYASEEFEDDERTIWLKADDTMVKATQRREFLIGIQGDHFDELRAVLGPEKFEKLFTVKSQLQPTELLKTLFHEEEFETLLDEDQIEKLQKTLQIRGGSISIHYPKPNSNS